MDQTNDDFTYEPLNTSKATIRVLRLETFSKKDGIRCSLKHIKLKHNAHVCLSYTWGEDAPSHIIHINDRPFKVRDSLYIFLQRAQKQKIREWLWIDAICIDQQNYTERIQQVRLMGDVYSKARCVLVHVGETSYNMKIAAPILKLLGSRPCDPWENDFQFDVVKYMNRTLSCLIGDFTKSKYWSRMWIVQEIILAKGVFIVLDRTVLDLRYFESAYCFASVMGGDPAWKVGALRETFLPKTKKSLIGILMGTAGFQCKLPNDRIYSLLSLLPDEISEKIAIDYTRDWLSLVLDVLEIFQWSLPKRQIPESSLWDFLVSLRTTLSILCWDCASSTEHTLEFPDGRKLNTISDLTSEVQDIYIVAGTIISNLCQPKRIGFYEGHRTYEEFASCSCCAVQLVENQYAPDEFDFVFSRPTDNVMCAWRRPKPGRKERLIEEYGYWLGNDIYRATECIDT